MARNWLLSVSLIVLAFLGCGCREPLSTGQIIGQNVRVRTAPTLKALTITNLNEDERVEILDTSLATSNNSAQKGWYYVRFEGGTGYVTTEFVKVLEPNPFQTKLRQFTARVAGVGEQYWGVVRPHFFQILPWAGLALALISIGCLLSRRSTLARFLCLMKSIQRLWTQEPLTNVQTTPITTDIQQSDEPNPRRIWVLILIYILFFASILLPAISYNSTGEVVYNTYGVFTLVGSLLIRSIGTALYLLLPLAVWQLLDLTHDWKFFIAAVAWLCFAEAARKPSPPPLIGAIVDTLLAVPFGRADLLVGGLLFVGVSCIVVGKTHRRSAKLIRQTSEQPGLSQDRVECDVLSALTNLGYRRTAAENALREARAENPNCDLEQLLRSSLRVLGRRFFK